jgi:DNA invertase Pin-like site-specific DNA recombinase
MLIGYARVSKGDQNLELQTHALESAGVERLFTDKMSGAKSSRPGLDEALAFARPGDVLVVWKLDRLGRSMKGLVDLAAQLEGRGVDLRSLTDGIDTKTASGRFFFNVMAALATMERELMLERTEAGLAAARRAGRVGGRRPKMTAAKLDAARKLLAANTAPRDVAASVGVSLATLYRHLPAADHGDS